MSRKGKGMTAQLAEQAFARVKPGTTCWRARIEGEVVEFLEAIEARLASGETPTWSIVGRTLRDHFGLEVSDLSVRRHYGRTCSCPR